MSDNTSAEERTKLILDMNELLHRHFQAQRKATVDGFANAQADLADYITSYTKQRELALLERLESRAKALDSDIGCMDCTGMWQVISAIRKEKERVDAA